MVRVVLKVLEKFLVDKVFDGGGIKELPEVVPVFGQGEIGLFLKQLLDAVHQGPLILYNSNRTLTM